MAALLQLLIYSILTSFLSCHGFNQNVLGVVYSPYVKFPEEGLEEPPSWDTYRLRDVVTMLNVVSTKFTKVATYGVGADEEDYDENEQYYRSNPQALSAEAAARVNIGKGEISVTVLIGVWQDASEHQMNNELNVALESARVANSIYPGTAEGFIVCGPADVSPNLEVARTLMMRLKVLKEAVASRNLNLKIGSRQRCSWYYGSSITPELEDIRRNIMIDSDFVICRVVPLDSELPSGGEAGFNSIKLELLNYRKEFQRINPNIEVMGETGWPSEGDKEWENVNDMNKFWKAIDSWSTENEFTMWVFEAFDQPWKDWAPNATNYGWWQLINNDLIDQVEGYFEKINGPPKDKGSSKTWTYVGLAVVLAILAIACIGLGFKYYASKHRNPLTKEDVEEFMQGISAEKAAREQEGQGSGSAFAYQLPYDKSFEIPQEKLKIETDYLLGAGQFGYVYKAVVEDMDNTVVALKMAKDDCSRSALKGILSEIKILIYLGKHPNVVSIYGACTGNLMNGSVYVALELCVLGSLKKYFKNPFLEGNESAIPTNGGSCEGYYISPDDCAVDTVSFQDLLRWSHEIACGMEYLTSKNVVHADLSTRNILLAADKTAKIADFGLSRKLYDYNVYVKKQQEPLPWRWMSIESLKRLEFSSKSDVWSYGVTLWEIFSLGEIPYPGYSWNPEFVENLLQGLRMKCPQKASPIIYQIMLSCWKLMPEERPTFAELRLSTGNLMEEEVSHNQ